MDLKTIFQNMHLSGVLESLAASLVWWVLGILVWQAFRFRKFLKTATEKRKERMEDLSNMVAEDHPLYELMRDDLILSIEIEMAAERSSMTTVQFQIVGNWVSFMGTWIYGSLHPGIGINVCLVLNVLTLLANYFLAYQYRKDVECFELGVLRGVRSRTASKMKVIRDEIAKRHQVESQSDASPKTTDLVPS